MATRRPESDATPAALQRDSHVALYMQLAEQLMREIGAGRYKPFERLPTEPELMRRFEVSRITVRQAIDHLLKRNLVVRKQGKGTFVTGPVVRHELQDLRGIIDEMRLQGLKPETKLLEFGLVGPPPRAAERLRTGAQRLYAFRRLYSLDGVPFALAWAHLPPVASGLTWAQVERHPTYSILVDLLGLQIARADMRISGRLAGRELGKLLRLPAKSPLLVFDRVSYCPAGIAREFTQFYVKAEAYEFTISVRGPLPISSALEEAV